MKNIFSWIQTGANRFILLLTVLLLLLQSSAFAQVTGIREGSGPARIRIVLDLDSPAKWIIYPLQDLLDRDEKNWSPNPVDDQINVPANPKNQWKWRMKISLEDLS